MRRRMLVFAVTAAILAVAAVGVVGAVLIFGRRGTPAATPGSGSPLSTGTGPGMPADMPGMDMGGSHVGGMPMPGAGDRTSAVHSGTPDRSQAVGGSGYGADSTAVSPATRATVLGVFGAGNLAVLVAAGTLRWRTARSRTRRTRRTAARAGADA